MSRLTARLTTPYLMPGKLFQAAIGNWQGFA